MSKKDTRVINVNEIIAKAAEQGVIRPPLPPARSFDEKIARHKSHTQEMEDISSGRQMGNVGTPGMPFLHVTALDDDGMQHHRDDPNKHHRIDIFQSVEDAREFCTRELESRGVEYDVWDLDNHVPVNWYSNQFNPTNGNVYSHALGEVPRLQEASGV